MRIFSLASQNSKPIRLVVSSYGGNIDDMMSLYDTIRFVRTPIYTSGLGKIMSAAVLLLACGTKGYRKMGKHARIMINNAYSGSEGDIFSQKNQLEEFDRQQELMEDCLCKETKITKAQIKKIMAERLDKYILSEEAVKLGIVDYIL